MAKSKAPAKRKPRAKRKAAPKKKATTGDAPPPPPPDTAAAAGPVEGATPHPAQLPPPAPKASNFRPGGAAGGGDSGEGPTAAPTAGPQRVPAPHPSSVPPQTLRPVVVLPFALWSRIADEPKLALADAEADALAAALAAVLDKYIPASGGQLPPEVALLLTTGMILAPRVMLVRKPEGGDDGDSSTEQPRAEGRHVDHVGDAPSNHGPGWADPPPARSPAGQ